MKKYIILNLLFSINALCVAQIINSNVGFEDGTWENDWHPDGTNSNDASFEVVTRPVRIGNYSFHVQMEDKRGEVLPKNVEIRRQNWEQEYWFGLSIYLEDWLTNPAEWNTLLQAHTVPHEWDWNTVSGDNGWTIYTTGALLKFHAQVLAFPLTSKPSVGAIGRAAWSTPVVENQWLDFVIHYKLTPFEENGGFIEMWYNGELVVSQSGPNIHLLDCDGFPREPVVGIQMGSYKKRVPKIHRSVYFDEIRIAKENGSYELVAPGQ